MINHFFKHPRAIYALVDCLTLTLLTIHVTANEHKTLVSVGGLGKIQGRILTTVHDKEFLAFTGIPFAEPPIGLLRFKPPVPKAPWIDSSHPLDATRDSPYCIQFSYKKREIRGNEDCLFLNVYTNMISDGKKRPVLVWFHGGGWSYGSGNMQTYGPRKLLDHDVVLVSLNYRLHAFGFLSTGDEASPGNYGHLDQVEALNWVKKNIHAFGGDPDKVTIAGESAGGASVYYHLLSPLSKDLFHFAIPMSGSSLALWSFENNPLKWAKKLAAFVGCPSTNSKDLVECLMLLPAETLTSVMEIFHWDVIIPFGPVVDNHFLLDDPLHLFQQGKFANRVPVLTGINKDEGIYIIAQPYRDSGNINYSMDDLGRVLALALNFDPSEVTKLILPVKKWYLDRLGDKKETEIITKIFSDAMFDIPHHETVNLLLQAGIKTFVYSYDYSGKHNIGKLYGVKDVSGVGHGEGLYSLFDGEIYFPENKDVDDPGTYQFLDYWVNFVTFGEPTPVDKHTEQILYWAPARKGNVQVYRLNTNVSIEVYDINGDARVEFWMKKVPAILTGNLKEEL